MELRPVWAVWAALVVACEPASPGIDASSPDMDAPSPDMDAPSPNVDGGPPDSGVPLEERTALHGFAQKGPFVAGSRVSVILLDEELFPTGSSFPTETFGALGEYELRSLEPGPYQIEVSGETRLDNGRPGPMRILRAIARTDAVGMVTASVTAVTHVLAPRIRVLVRDEGQTLEVATAQAEQELLAALDEILADGVDPGPVGATVWPTSADSPASRFVMLVSQIAERLASIDAMADDLRDGSLEATIEEIRTIVANTRGLGWSQHGYEELTERWAAEGLEGPPPEIRAILDTDGDGVADLEDVCAYTPDPPQLDTDSDGVGDECDFSPEGTCPPGSMPFVLYDFLYCMVLPDSPDHCPPAPYSQVLASSLFFDGDFSHITPVCIRTCDPLGRCPERTACNGTMCVPAPQDANPAPCGLFGTDSCMDGFRCETGMSPSRCGRSCDPAQGDSVCPLGQRCVALSPGGACTPE